MKSRLACFPRRWRLLSPLLLPWAFFVLTSNIWPNAAPPPCLLPPLLLSIIKTRRSGGLNVTLAFKGDLLVSVYSWTLLQQRDSQSLFNTLGGFTLSCLIFSSIVSFT